MTKIRTTDSRSRVTVSAAEGATYAESVGEDGTITLTPLDIPIASSATAVPMVYLNAGADSVEIVIQADRTEITDQELADYIAQASDKFAVPIALRNGHSGHVVGDLLAMRGRCGMFVTSRIASAWKWNEKSEGEK